MIAGRTFVHVIIFCFFFISTVILAAQQQEGLLLTRDIPVCAMPSSKPLPTKYYRIAHKWEEYRWINDVEADDDIISGGGYERIDGSQMFNWQAFVKFDIDGDGLCDWFVIMLAPYSTGGDSGVLNTIYMGMEKGWRRIGATIPEDRPDVLGAGDSSREQSEFAFSAETPLLLWDRAQGRPYLIGVFGWRRDGGRVDQEGYHIYVWDESEDRLEELDKWQSGSAAAQVYAFFRQHGAADPTQRGAGRIVAFDPDVEKTELERRCRDQQLLGRSPGLAQGSMSFRVESDIKFSAAPAAADSVVDARAWTCAGRQSQ